MRHLYHCWQAPPTTAAHMVQGRRHEQLKTSSHSPLETFIPTCNPNNNRYNLSSSPPAPINPLLPVYPFFPFTVESASSILQPRNLHHILVSHSLVQTTATLLKNSDDEPRLGIHNPAPQATTRDRCHDAQGSCACDLLRRSYIYAAMAVTDDGLFVPLCRILLSYPVH